MSAVLAPYGFIPIGNMVGGTPVRDLAAMPGGISAAYATSIYSGQPVILDTDGTLKAIAAGNTDLYGVFGGVQYIATAGGTPMWMNWWTGGTPFVAGSLVAYLTMDPYALYRVQADGPIAATAVGDQADVSNFTDGSTGTGISGCTLSSTLVGASSQGQWRIMGLWNSPTNAWGDAYTEVVVQLARSQIIANKVAV